jgi:molecular chaperone HtpG
MTDPVDEILVGSVFEFQDKPLKSVGKGEALLGTEEERKKAESELDDKKKTYGDLLELMQKTLDDNIKEVRLSTRLTTSPACLVSSEHDMSPQLERLLRQAEGSSAMKAQKRILELNPSHPLLEKLQSRFGQDPADPGLRDYAHLLYGHALLAEGSELVDPARYNRLVGELMLKAL